MAGLGRGVSVCVLPDERQVVRGCAIHGIHDVFELFSRSTVPLVLVSTQSKHGLVPRAACCMNE